MCLVLKCMQENISMHRIFCPWYIIYVPALWFLCFWISTHHSLTYWIWISTYHPLIYNPLFFVYFPFLYMLSLFILQLKDFVHGNYWGWIYILLLDLSRNSCEKMRLQVPGRNQTWGPGALRFRCIGIAGQQVSLLDL
jgi:hypothetical protein